MAGRDVKRPRHLRKAVITVLLGSAALAGAGSVTPSHDPQEEAGAGRQAASRDLHPEVDRMAQAQHDVQAYFASFASVVSDPVTSPRPAVVVTSADQPLATNRNAEEEAARAHAVAHDMVSRLLHPPAEPASTSSAQPILPMAFSGSGHADVHDGNAILQSWMSNRPYSPFSVQDDPPAAPQAAEAILDTIPDPAQQATTGLSTVEVAATSAVTMLVGKLIDALAGKAVDEGLEAIWQLIRRQFRHDKQVMADLDEIEQLPHEPTGGLTTQQAELLERLIDLVEKEAETDSAFGGQLLTEIIRRIASRPAAYHLGNQPSGA